MKERPIIFNADMVRAVLDGRKTQTRRIMKVQPVLNGDFYQVYGAGWRKAIRSVTALLGHSLSNKCPFGAVGDRLWVRETFRVHSRATDVATLVYKASEQQSWTQQTHRLPIEKCNKPAVVDKWTPSIHMPRWASRITLEITGVRVERLTALSDDCARNEGCPAQLPHNPDDEHQARTWFRGLWSEIYGDESWQANPWVWVIEFKRVEVE
jgi:hypothetical protein